MLRVLWGVLLLSVVTTGVVAASDGPLADAGLDQTVDQHSTVFLDAGGSVAPDGELVGYEWVIERPDGSTVEPGCPTCERTSFVPERAGEYAVTVTVTDDSGDTTSDTLYVTVRAVEPPSATLYGPTAVGEGESVVYQVEGEAGDRELSAYELAVDGQHRAREMAENSSFRELTVTFSETGERTVTGTVVDEIGLTDEDTLAVEVLASDECSQTVCDGAQSGGGSGGSGGMLGADATVYEGADGETIVEIDSTIADLNPEGTTTFMENGNQYTIDNTRYREAAYQDGDDSTSKEGDIAADRVLENIDNVDNLKEDAKAEGDLKTFDSTDSSSDGDTSESSDGGGSDSSSSFLSSLNPFTGGGSGGGGGYSSGLGSSWGGYNPSGGSTTDSGNSAGSYIGSSGSNDLGSISDAL